AALAAVDSEFGRTTDPVRMYMREMGTVELLTREGEIQIAKRIEEGAGQVLTALAHYPLAVGTVLNDFSRIEAGEMRLAELLVGLINPADLVEEAVAAPAAVPDADADSEDDSDDEEDDEDGDAEETVADTGPDPEE